MSNLIKSFANKLMMLGAGVLLCSFLGTTYVYAAAILIDNVKVVNSTQQTSLDKVDVLIDQGKIVRVGEQIDVTDGIRVVNGEGKVLTAGLFNADTQMGIVEVGQVVETRDGSSNDERFTSSFNPIDAFNPSSVLIPYNRMQGLTHTLVVPTNNVSMIAGAAAVVNLSQTSNSIEVKTAGIAITLGNSGADLKGGSRAVALASLGEALEDSRDYAANKSAYNNGARREHALSRLDLIALVPVVQRRIPLLVYVERAAEITRVLEFAKQQKISVILVGASEAWRVAEQIAEAQVPVIIDPIRNLPTAYEAVGSRLDNAKILDKAGVQLLFSGMGSKATHNAYLVRQSAGNAVANGLPYHAAIAALTANPATVFGLEGYGQVVEGAKASVVLWDGDPLEVSSSVEMVLINGIDYPLESRATRLRDRYYQYLKDKQ